MAAQLLDPDAVVPQVGQGALAVECRADDDETRALLATIDDATSRRTVMAERAFLAELGGGCDLPVGAHATIDGSGTLRLTGILATADGRIVLRQTEQGDPDDGEEIGRAVARHLRDDAGGDNLLASLLADVPAAYSAQVPAGGGQGAETSEVGPLA
jgi:hydroxymethylbilane synthase